ncbi:MAG: TolC family protein [Lentisphaeria bacterium]|nr:TolC family protein [Lentisphaeria bacterium]
MRKIVLFGIAAASALLAVCLSSCKSRESYMDERAEKAVLDTQRARYMELSDGRAYTLDQCIKFALKHNLQVRLHELDVKVAQENKMAELMGMLPELNFNENFTARSNTAASGSEKIKESGSTYGYSTSEERQVNYFNIDLLFSVIDLGLSYWNTEIAHNKALLHKQRAVRVTQNIQLDVVKAYFKVAAAQRAKNRTEKLLEDTRKRSEEIRKLSTQGKVDPIMAFDVQRKFTAMEKQLTGYVRVYTNACVELRTLMGLYPSPMISVDESCLDSFPSVPLPSIELMEQIALLQRPEMYESDIQRQINVMECHKVILMMFPNVKLYADWSNSSNKYLYHRSWMELGIRAAYNLLLLPHQIAKYSAYSKQVEAETMKRYAQSLAVMAQVRLSHANLRSALELYKKDKKISDDYRNYLSRAKELQGSGSGKFKGADVEYMQLETVKAEIDSVLALGNCYVAHYQLLNAMGVDNADFRTIDTYTEELADAQKAAEKVMKEARMEYNEERIKEEHRLAEVAAEKEKAESDRQLELLRKKINEEIDKKVSREKVPAGTVK